MSGEQVIEGAAGLLHDRQQQRRTWLREHVLQPLEFIATGGDGTHADLESLMQAAARAADELRSVIEGDGSLVAPKGSASRRFVRSSPGAAASTPAP